MIQKKSKCSDQLRCAFYTFLGQRRSRKLLAFALKARYRTSKVRFPVNIYETKEILIILPEQHLDVLHQLKNVISLIKLFKHATVSIVCEHSTSSYIKMIPGLNIIEYDRQEQVSFSASLVKEIRELNHIDICFLLIKNPDLPLLYLAGASGADIRAGYSESGGFPFLNLQIRPDTNKKYLTDWNCSIAKLFGASPEDVRWSVARKTIDEINHLLKELKIEKNVHLIGIDVAFLLNQFGNSWTEILIQNLKKFNPGQLYFYIDEKFPSSQLQWVQKQNIPFLGNLSASRTAALISRSRLVITGNTMIYALASLLKKPAVGFFKDDEIEMYCPQTANLMGIPYKTVSEEMVFKTITLIASLKDKRKV